MKIAIYEDIHVEGLVLREADPINAAGDISLLLNSADGFSLEEVVTGLQTIFAPAACRDKILSITKLDSCESSL